MTGHVHARLSGHGLALVPFAPFRFERLAEGPGVKVTHASPQGPRGARITPGASPPAVELEPGTVSLDEVVTLSHGRPAGPWRIETSVFTCAWPEGLALVSPPDNGTFDLLGPRGSILYVQGPYAAERVAQPETLVTPDQTLGRRGRGEGFEWMEVHYTQEHQRWFKRYAFVPLRPKPLWGFIPRRPRHVLMVTAQALEQDAALLTAATDALAASIRPFV